MGLFSSGSAKRVAALQAKRINEAYDLLDEAKDEYLPLYDPYIQAGEGAITDLNTTLGGVQDRINALDPTIDGLYAERDALQPQVDEIYDLSQQMDPVINEILGGGQGFTTSPGYEFALEEGLKAIERSRAAEGTLNQGATGKELVRYSQGVANQEYDSYLGDLYNQLNSINTQLGGRTTALNAGQSQINQGINLVGTEMNQINAQQNLANQYQALVNSGMSAADAAASMGMSVAEAQGNLLIQQGNAYASGMTAKSNQLLGMGQGIAQLGGAAVGAMTGNPQMAMMGAQIGGNIAGGNQQITPYSTNTTSYSSTMPTGSIDLGNELPWLKSSPVTAAQQLSQSSYSSTPFLA